MLISSYILTITTLVIIIFQDVKHRAIHWSLLILLLASSFAMSYLGNHLDLNNIGISLLFFCILFSVLWLYLMIKTKEPMKAMKESIGLGDILFLLAVIPLFQFRNYILFIIAGMIFSLLLFIGVRFLKKIDTVPLAGYLSLFLIGILVVDFFVFPDLLNTPVL